MEQQTPRIKLEDGIDRHFFSSRRFRRVFIIGLSSGFANIVAASISLFTVPMALNYLGSELYGIWMTATAALVAFSLAEFGISSSLVNVVASADLTSQKERARVRSSISAAFFSLMAIIVGVLAVFLLITPFVNWNVVFNVGANAEAARIELVVTILATTFLLVLPLGIADQINAGLQEAFHNAVWKVAGAFAGFAGLAISIYLDASLPWLVFSLAGGLLFGRMGNCMTLFLWRKPWMRPLTTSIRKDAVRSVLKVGGLFFGLKVASIVSHQSDALIVTHIVGPAGVAQYSIGLKLFMFLTSFLVFFLKPLWPAYNEAIARGDTAWVRRALRQVFLASLAYIVPAAVLLAVLTPTIIEVWLGNALIIPKPFLLWAAVFVVISVLESNLTKLYYAINAVDFHFRWVVIMTLVNLPLSIYLTYQIGVAGALAGSAISQALFTVLPLILRLPRVLTTLSPNNLDNGPKQ